MSGTQRPNLMQGLVRAARHDALTAMLVAFLLVVVLIAILASVLAPYGPATQDLANALQGPSSAHWLGTDDLGRDVLSRIMFGARVSLRASLQSVGVALLIAVPLGLVAGYLGGVVDNMIMRVLDVLLALPGLVLVIALATALGGGLTNTMLALSIVFVPSLARITRAETLSVRHEAYIEASTSIGSSTSRILRSRILRNIAPTLYVQTAITLGIAIGAEAALSFIGLGVEPPQASWGSLLRRSFDFIFAHPTGVIWPALFITLTAWGFNALGDALGDAMAVRGGSDRRGFHALTAVQRDAKDRPHAVASTPVVDASDTHNTGPVLLDVSHLSVAVSTDHGTIPLVQDVSFRVAPGQVLGVVGESGSGKTVTALSLTRLFASPPGVITDGSVTLNGADLTVMSERQLRDVRGRDVSMIFQNPKASLNPALRVGDQIAEALRLHLGLDAARAKARSAELLEAVGIARSRLSDYPHQMSGGMCQRLMVAMAIACRPPLVIADEPTSALDVTVQAEILDLLHRLKSAGTSIVLITHDFGVVADICDHVLVMYAGQIVEQGPVLDVLTAPVHPYTRALLSAMPSVAQRGSRLESIDGQVPLPGSHGPGCRFADRCAMAIDECGAKPIPLIKVGGERHARCIRIHEARLQEETSVPVEGLHEGHTSPAAGPIERTTHVSPD